MSEVAVKVENLSKQFLIGKNASGNLRETLSNKASSLFSKKNVNEEVFWALQEISFQVNKGDVLGIIGKNGAGKSTLLKILSQITAPTKGQIEINGRVSSLLEVGTGFHPELTGRENVFLNGTILGMKRKEVRAKFDEIVAFSGVEKFLDTPIKHYSSGMKVRLAFSVAAHLDPEILIVDEVLAVGDAEFQRKCLGKMGEVSREHGRSVLFVSHNIRAVKNLCNKGIVLQQGQMMFDGSAEEATELYLSSLDNSQGISTNGFNPQSAIDGQLVLEKLTVEPKGKNPGELLDLNDALLVAGTINLKITKTKTHVNAFIKTLAGETVFVTYCNQFELAEESRVELSFLIPPNLLNEDHYSIDIMVVQKDNPIHNFEQAISFQINNLTKTKGFWHQRLPGVIRPILPWTVSFGDIQTQ